MSSMLADLANKKSVPEDGENSDCGAPGGPICVILLQVRPFVVDETMLMLEKGRCWFLYVWMLA